MDITPPADDKGLRRLKLDNEKGEVKQTSAVSPYPRIESSEERHEPHPPVTLERRTQQRRRKERRQFDMETAYDTRSDDERRKDKRRVADRNAAAKSEDDASSGQDQPVEHIDTKV